MWYRETLTRTVTYPYLPEMLPDPPALCVFIKIPASAVPCVSKYSDIIFKLSAVIFVKVCKYRFKQWNIGGGGLSCAPSLPRSSDTDWYILTEVKAFCFHARVPRSPELLDNPLGKCR